MQFSMNQSKGSLLEAASMPMPRSMSASLGMCPLFFAYFMLTGVHGIDTGEQLDALHVKIEPFL
jgi:hypothetical protein